MGSTTHKHFLKLVHHSLFAGNFFVNKVFAIVTIALIYALIRTMKHFFTITFS
jgi:hypothetical protein